MFGTNRDTGDWLFHNPSGFDVRTQQNVAMPRATFDRYFANRGILIAPSRCARNEPGDRSVRRPP
ncbi:hypothetical protein [Burkholderia sp.]|nr:hypothetical protein [Burkholderia sp.]MCL4637042.1 hypothetical protein [Burkholderia sp.]